ncbi:protein FAM149B1-like isoform X2 [Mizuhopecten yessoensis]|uniref:DUF3719 domain-containing protein n=1 Tax=Mizuhopecten yessoensis TaxID=6573 RepID=A0A210QM83_MIZYE|nr:protein FAM149B1-like isoform X2 [Mizuhopecten yessoensis]OWF49843.1 hypothetical protein KP79_PYT05762 [Mizuhopecten yessoensis]
MGTDVLVRYVPMSYPKDNREVRSAEVSCISRGGLDRARVSLPLYKRHYGLSKAIVCVSAKIHSRRRGLASVVPGVLDINHMGLPPDYLSSVENAITNYHGTPSSSGRSSPTITETQSNASSAHGGWTTGNTTERSSTDSNYSWDEFDKQAAKTVQCLFDQIDSMLFEQNVEGPSYILKECKEWNLKFPHLRILGSQLFHPQDMGFQAIEREGSRPSTGSMGLVDITDQEMVTTQDIHSLTLSGQRIRPQQPPLEARSYHSGMSTSNSTSEYTHLEEEIFSQEGEYEEIIAIDYVDIYDDDYNLKKQLTPRRRRVGYPPITPNACVKDAVMSSVFDNMWQEILEWMRNINRQYSILVLEESKPSLPVADMTLNISSSNHMQLPPSREPSFYIHRMPRSYTTMGVSKFSTPQLDELLQISRKDLITREKSLLHDPTDPLTARPASSIQPTHKNQNRPNTSITAGGNKFISGSRGLANSRLLRLAPLDQRSRTPNVDDERTGPNGALRVTRITPQNDLTFQRNGALPPLTSEIEPSPSISRTQKIHSASNRASSAVDKDIRAPHRNQYIIPVDTRPSTTHAMRSDTPLGQARRASTPFGINNIPARTLGDRALLGIHGSSIQPSNDISHLGHMQPEILEEGLDDVGSFPNQWTPSPPSHHNPYRTLKSRLVKS